MRIVGEKVTLRDISPSDSPDILRWQEDPDVVRFDPAVGSPVVFVWLSIDTLNGTHIGQCSLYDFKDHTVQLGLRIGEKSYWNRGYGTEVVELLVKYGFDNMHINYIWVKVIPENIGAVRCYEKCGFRLITSFVLDGYLFNAMTRWRSGP